MNRGLISAPLIPAGIQSFRWNEIWQNSGIPDLKILLWLSYSLTLGLLNSELIHLFIVIDLATSKIQLVEARPVVTSSHSTILTQ